MSSVDFFDGVGPCSTVRLLNRRAEECADAVGDEVRRVLAGHHAFAQMAVAELADEREDLGPRVRAGNHFDQMQIARRIEEVRAEEVLAELVGIAFGDLRQRDAAGVGGDDGAGRRDAAISRS